MAKMKDKGKTGLTLSWNRISAAAGYDIYISRCNHKDKKNQVRKVDTITDSRITTWEKSGLKKHKCYKAYVKAYVMKNGKKTYIRTSPVVHSYTTGGNTEHTNARSVTVSKTRLSLKKGKTYQIKAKVTKQKKKKGLMPESHIKKIRYISTDKNIASVSKKGRIKGKQKGTCYIYVYAHNGVCKKIKVKVGT